MHAERELMAGESLVAQRVLIPDVSGANHAASAAGEAANLSGNRARGHAHLRDCRWGVQRCAVQSAVQRKPPATA